MWLVLQTAWLPIREAKGIRLSQGTVSLSLFEGSMHGMMPVITKYHLDTELTSSELPACMCVGVWGGGR